MTPLILLVGFLGAGKTTYLRRLLPELRAQGLDPHVIINDYQNAGVDAELLRELAESIVPISGSCVCCGSREELLDALTAIPPAPGRVVVVETNGATNSEELIELLSLDPGLERFTQPVQLSVIDGSRWQKRFWHNSLELEQARTASFVFVSRQTEIDAKRRTQLAASLALRGIHAPQRDPAAFALEVGKITAAVRDLAGRSRTVNDSACSCGHDHDGPDDHDHHHHEDSASSHRHEKDCEATHHFSSLQIDLPEVVARPALQAYLDALPREVIRVKGLARLQDSPEEYHVFQKVDSGAVQWLPIGRTSRLDHPVMILIGPGLDAADLQVRAASLGPAAAR